MLEWVRRREEEKKRSGEAEGDDVGVGEFARAEGEAYSRMQLLHVHYITPARKSQVFTCLFLLNYSVQGSLDSH